MNRRQFLAISSAGIGLAWFSRFGSASGGNARKNSLGLTEAQWRKRLTPKQFQILRQGGTELPFSSPLSANMKAGIYHCAGCDLALFSSRTKFHSGTGWPSFWRPLARAVTRHVDRSLFMTRTEIRCARCDGHLGHVFDDGPQPTGLRYCMNGLALSFHSGEKV